MCGYYKLLLDLAKKLFEDQTSLDRMVTKIMMQATELVKCERCTVLLLDTNNKVRGSLVNYNTMTSLLYRICHLLTCSLEEGQSIEGSNW